ncbi:hypothetical protein K0M31_017049 [Melipona bicolor]|uniref:Uncharacterized protein n=1 Tax=Melipona bicolor TaxID=60889 RepID=A0AA40KED3_9HYME|nr:hypothetical protein K0M31_017049 [Melipona bicolor]
MRCRDTAAPTTASTYRTRILLSLKRARKKPARSTPGGREANEPEMDEDVEKRARANEMRRGRRRREEGEGSERRRRQKRKIARADGAKIVPLFAF